MAGPPVVIFVPSGRSHRAGVVAERVAEVLELVLDVAVGSPGARRWRTTGWTSAVVGHRAGDRRRLDVADRSRGRATPRAPRRSQGVKSAAAAASSATILLVNFSLHPAAGPRRLLRRTCRRGRAPGPEVNQVGDGAAPVGPVACRGINPSGWPQPVRSRWPNRGRRPAEDPPIGGGAAVRRRTQDWTGSSTQRRERAAKISDGGRITAAQIVTNAEGAATGQTESAEAGR